MSCGEAIMNLRASRRLAVVTSVLLCAACLRADVLSSSNPALVGQPVTLTIEIDAPSGVTATPTGAVIFTDSGQSIGTVTLQGGLASLSTQFGTTGDHVIVAQYSGDANFQPASSPPFVQNVTPDALFTIPVSPSLIVQRSYPTPTARLT